MSVEKAAVIVEDMLGKLSDLSRGSHIEEYYRYLMIAKEQIDSALDCAAEEGVDLGSL